MVIARDRRILAISGLGSVNAAVEQLAAAEHLCVWEVIVSNVLLIVAMMPPCIFVVMEYCKTTILIVIVV